MLAELNSEADCDRFAKSSRRATPRRSVVIDVHHDLRGEAQAIIEETYLSSFNVRIASHYPRLIGVVDCSGAVIAAAGCRAAHEGKLFLEHYIDEPADVVLQRRLKTPIERSDIAEIGNFATRGSGGAAALFNALAHHLHEQGVRYALATATRRLRRAFTAFNFGANEIARAEQRRMPNRGCGWNGYFAHDPMVVCGHVESGLARAKAMGAGH